MGWVLCGRFRGVNALSDSILKADDFALFFRGIYEDPDKKDGEVYAPFPWQEKLVRDVLREGWPDVLDIPTGGGKTSVLDIALFTLAVDPAKFSRRIVLVVDRRLIVDQAAEHARRILERLRRPQNEVVERVSEALRKVWGASPTDDPISVAVLRGGMPRDDSWARRPDQPVVAVSTVDQVGSRLLFRGYGVSRTMSPIHAGLLGNDTLIILDEVHLSIPFADTLRSIRVHWQHRSNEILPKRWNVVQMSATPGYKDAKDRIVSLSVEDRNHPMLRKRLGARKRVSLKKITVSGDEERKRRQFAAELVKFAVEHVSAGAEAVAVVVNRVATAREIYDRLEEYLPRLDRFLLTGRMRPIDRDVRLARVLGRIKAGRDRGDEGRQPIVVVSTQCIEAGADFDFDALVSECASIDALRQRFGRLDRRGELEDFRKQRGLDTERPWAVIAVRSDQVTQTAEDPVYGQALRRTWEWLNAYEQSSGIVDFGVDQLILPTGEDLRLLLAPMQHAPILLPAHLRSWAQTQPRPFPEPDPSLWLHGPDRGEAEVQVVWRADVTRDLLETAFTSDDQPSQEAAAARNDLITLLEASPPGSLEAVSLPLRSVRAWLRSDMSSSYDLADVVGEIDSTVDQGKESETGRLALRWAGEESAVVSAKDINPGDTLVVPSAYGGLSEGNWHPEAQNSVPDLGDQVQWHLRGRAILRLHPDVLIWLPEPYRSACPTVPGESDPDSSPVHDIREWLRTLPSDLPEPWAQIVQVLSAERGGPRYIALPNGTWALVSRRRRRQVIGEDVSTEDDGGSFAQIETTLNAHCKSVEEKAKQFASALGLPESLVNDIALAARYHDLGKADPRFQRMLVGGSEVRAAMLEEPLAKSGASRNDWQARIEARRRSGFPRGYRHELLSVALLEGRDDVLVNANDKELVLHLIASHHGWCRPFPPLIVDENTRQVSLQYDGHEFRGSTDHGLERLDSGVADRFWALIERYGFWGLAWLEAILRLADHRASEAAQEVI